MSQGQKNFKSNDDNSPTEDIILQLIDDLVDQDMFKSIVEDGSHSGGGGGASEDASEKKPNAISNESPNQNQTEKNRKRTPKILDADSAASGDMVPISSKKLRTEFDSNKFGGDLFGWHVKREDDETTIARKPASASNFQDLDDKKPSGKSKRNQSKIGSKYGEDDKLATMPNAADTNDQMLDMKSSAKPMKNQSRKDQNTIVRFVEDQKVPMYVNRLWKRQRDFF